MYCGYYLYKSTSHLCTLSPQFARRHFLQVLGHVKYAAHFILIFFWNSYNQKVAIVCNCLLIYLLHYLVRVCACNKSDIARFLCNSGYIYEEEKIIIKTIYGNSMLEPIAFLQVVIREQEIGLSYLVTRTICQLYSCKINLKFRKKILIFSKCFCQKCIEIKVTVMWVFFCCFF